MFRLLCLFLFFWSFLAGELYDPIAVYLTWQKNPESTMTVRWLTGQDRREDVLEYRLENVAQWSSAAGSHVKLPRSAPYLLHSVELTELQPGACYQFRTGKDAKVYKFQTMSADANQIRFVVGGDMYHDALSFVRATNAQAAKMSPHFALVGGDIAYAASGKENLFPKWFGDWIKTNERQTVERWIPWLIAWKEGMVTPSGCLIPLLPAIGNHETDGGYGQTPAQAPFFYTLFAMPGVRGYNVLDFGAQGCKPFLSLFLLDSGHTHPVSGAQKRWLASALEQRSGVPHTFALYHVPAYPSFRPYNNLYCAQVRRSWIPLFDKFHLTAAFENHDHLYKRTHPMVGGKIDQGGVRYFGDGAWGIEEPRSATDVAKKWYLAKTASARHFLYVEIEGSCRTVSAISSDGELLDMVQWKGKDITQGR
jgi:hypothetical protein